MTSFDEFAKQLQESAHKSLNASPVDTGMGFFEGFLKSAGWSIPGLVGIRPPEEVMQWQAENPVAAFGSELVGTAVPYAGWAKATTAIPKAQRVLQGLEIEGKPLLSGALRETTRFAPFEAGRLAGAAAFGDQGTFGDVAGAAALDMGLFGAFGAAGAAFKSARAAAEPTYGSYAKEIATRFPDYDPTQPRQFQLRKLRDISQGLTIDDPLFNTVNYHMGELATRVRRDYVPQEGRRAQNEPRYVNPLEGGNRAELERWFEPSLLKDGKSPDIEAHSIRVRRLLESDFDKPDIWKAVASKAGLPENFEDWGQYYRFVSGKSAKETGNIMASIERNMKPLGDGWWYAREQNEGMFVMARRLGPQTRKVDERNTFMFFKTDTPDKFLPSRAEFKNVMVRRQAWETKVHPEERTLRDRFDMELFKVLDNYMEANPPAGYSALARDPKSAAGLLDTTFKKLGLDKVTGEAGLAARSVMEFLRPYVSPATSQFAKHPTARYTFGVSKLVFDQADATARTLMYGETEGLKGGSLFKALLQKPKELGGIKGLLDKLDDKDLHGVWRTWLEGWSPQKAAENGVSPKAVEFLKKLSAIDKWQMKQIEGTRLVTGAFEGATAAENHYMISRTWKGSWRVPLYNDAKHLVAMGSGNTRAEALAKADAIIKEAEKRGLRLQKGDNVQTRQADREADLLEARKMRQGTSDAAIAREIERELARKGPNPKIFNEPKGVSGYQGESVPWTKKELEDMLFKHISQVQRGLAEATVRYKMRGLMGAIAELDPQLFTELSRRIDDMALRPGPINEAIAKGVDKALAPFFGKNAASKISAATGELMFHMQFGGNLAHGVSSLLTFMQTTLPHIAFVVGATPAQWARHYTVAPVIQNGQVRGSVGFMDMMKLLKNSFGEMGNPGPELREAFNRGIREGIVDPRFVEDYLGANSRTVTNFKEALAQPDGFIGMVKAASSFIPALTEKLSRGHTFTLGHMVGRDILGMTGDRLYHFAREFTNNTMYLYSTADRPRIFTGPIGSMYGLFKNWSFHYVAQMMTYAGEGISRNNWAPFMWMMGGTAATAGIGGLPMYGVADTFSRLATDKSLFYNLYKMFGYETEGTGLADTMFYGLPSFFGTSLQASTSSPGSDVVRDASQLFSFVLLDRGIAAGKAIGSAWGQWQASGTHPANTEVVRDQLIRALAPRALYRALSVAETNAVQSMNTGYPIVDNLSIAERVLYGVGVNPLHVEKSMRATDELWRDQTKLKSATERMGIAWAQAVERGDDAMLTNITYQAIAQGVDLGSVIKSAQVRDRKAQFQTLDRQFRPEKVQDYRDVVLGGR